MHQGRSSRRIGRVRSAASLAVMVVGLVPAITLAQLTTQDIQSLERRAKAEGWTFTVGENEATRYPLSALCGTVPPPGWVDPPAATAGVQTVTLPSTFDWRQYGGVTPIKNQASCGSCWAFAAVGSVEAVIRLNLGIIVDLSEQWLVSCTSAGSCSGGWHNTALSYMSCSGASDSCGGRGAVSESAFPYVASDVACGCPYPHPYCIRGYSSVNNSIDDIKYAIYYHGPVSTTVYVNSAFQAYHNGVFNACENQTINHAVVLVGWDDSLGCWIMRNSWSSGWGELGYMRIAYGCSRIGGSAYYVTYDMPGPASVTATDGTEGDFVRITWSACGGASGYEVWRSTTSSLAAATKLADVAGTTTYDDASAVGGVTYYYWVRARNQITVSAYTGPDTGYSWPDCNHNNVPDPQDIAGGTSQDCDQNNTPDECQPDIDHDGVIDTCDPDRDGDGILEDGDYSGTAGDHRCTGGNTVGCDDNCPANANADQQDADADSMGDTCDACPTNAVGAAVDASGCPLPIPGDYDHDGDVDQEDFGSLQLCIAGPAIPISDPSCRRADLDADNDVDSFDVAEFIACFEGAGVAANPACGN